MAGHGDHAETFAVHKDLLIKHSDFFASALNSNSNWAESSENRVMLRDDKPYVVGIFTQFLYTGKPFISKDDDVSEVDNADQYRDREWRRLSECWVFGEKILSSSFKDAIMDAILFKLRTGSGSPVSVHGYVYNRSAGVCGMRRLLVDLAVWKWTDDAMATQGRSSSQAQFFVDVAVALNKIKANGLHGEPPFTKGDSCSYHDHGDSSPCYKKLF